MWWKRQSGHERNLGGKRQSARAESGIFSFFFFLSFFICLFEVVSRVGGCYNMAKPTPEGKGI